MSALVAGHGRLVTVPTGPTMNRELARLAEFNNLGDETLIGVTLTNLGRSRCGCSAGASQCPSTATYWVDAGGLGPPLPAVVEAGGQETWMCNIGTAIKLASACDGIKESQPPVRVSVVLGTGKEVVSTKSLQVLPSPP